MAEKDAVWERPLRYLILEIFAVSPLSSLRNLRLVTEGQPLFARPSCK